MAIKPLKVNKETSTVTTDIILAVANKSWIKVLGDNALRILVQFTAQDSRGEALLGDYDSISKNIGKSRGSVSDGLSELEAFGFILIKKIINKKTKLYELNNQVIPLSQRWVDFFSNTSYKKVCLALLQKKKVDNSIIDELQLKVVNSNDVNIQQTLGRLLYLFVDKKGFTIDDLLEEERTRMQEDLFPGGFTFGTETTQNDNWQSILTPEEKAEKGLMDVLVHYVALVDYPTRSDVEGVKRVLTRCYPYQIKNGITNLKNHPVYGQNFRSFKYIEKQLFDGRYGTRKNSNAKKNFNNSKNETTTRRNNQTDMGFKASGLSRTEILERIDSSSTLGVVNDELNNNVNIEEEAFDFSTLRG